MHLNDVYPLNKNSHVYINSNNIHQKLISVIIHKIFRTTGQ